MFEKESDAFTLCGCIYEYWDGTSFKEK